MEYRDDKPHLQSPRCSQEEDDTTIGLLDSSDSSDQKQRTREGRRQRVLYAVIIVQSIAVLASTIYIWTLGRAQVPVIWCESVSIPVDIEHEADHA